MLRRGHEPETRHLELKTKTAKNLGRNMSSFKFKWLQAQACASTVVDKSPDRDWLPIYNEKNAGEEFDVMPASKHQNGCLLRCALPQPKRTDGGRRGPYWRRNTVRPVFTLSGFLLQDATRTFEKKGVVLGTPVVIIVRM